MHIVSFDKEALNIAIYSQYSGLELTSPVYFSTGACHVSLSQKTNAVNALEVSSGIDSDQKDLKGALLYKLQIKHANRADNQFDNSITPNKNIEKSIHLFVFWNVGDHDYEFRVCLIEFDNEFTWNEDKLRKLYDKNRDQLKKYNGIISSTWITGNNMILKTSSRINYLEENSELNITISEEKDDYAIRPFYIDLER
jgi:hypothetical protein